MARSKIKSVASIGVLLSYSALALLTNRRVVNRLEAICYTLFWILNFHEFSHNANTNWDFKVL